MNINLAKLISEKKYLILGLNLAKKPQQNDLHENLFLRKVTYFSIRRSSLSRYNEVRMSLNLDMNNCNVKFRKKKKTNIRTQYLQKSLYYMERLVGISSK